MKYWTNEQTSEWINEQTNEWLQEYNTLTSERSPCKNHKYAPNSNTKSLFSELQRNLFTRHCYI